MSPSRWRSRKLKKKLIREKVERVLQAVQLDHLITREATKLSGGQQQRLALARALVMEPQLLLLDEPLSNLDAKLRDRMRTELKRLQRELCLTTVYVTHDQSEALALSHEIAVMNDGRVVQIGTPRQIYETPHDQFVADFVGTTNFVGGTVSTLDDGAGHCVVATAMGDLKAHSTEGVAKNGTVIVSVRPEDVELSEAPLTAADGENVRQGHRPRQGFPGRIPGFRGQGGRSRAAGARASLAAHADRRPDLHPDESRQVHRDPVRCAETCGGGELERSASC